MRETRTLEFKETITNTFLKTVSAFSNYDGGIILFGVDDDGNIKGLSDVKQACLDIENKINDSITPQPDYMLEIQNIRVQGNDYEYFFKNSQCLFKLRWWNNSFWSR